MKVININWYSCLDIYETLCNHHKLNTNGTEQNGTEQNIFPSLTVESVDDLQTLFRVPQPLV